MIGRAIVAAPLLIAGVLLLDPSAAAAELGPDPFFETRVRPILATRCWGCHAAEASGGLRLDSRATALAGGGRGPAIVPGKPSESLLVKAIKGEHATLKMPPEGGALSAPDIAAIERWIRDGVAWPMTDTELFHKKVWPLLQRACVGCHGEEEPENNLRLDSREALLRGGKSGPAVKPGTPDDSLLIQAVRWTHPEFEMPLEKKMPAGDIALLETWVTRGVPWPAPPVSAIRSRVADGPRWRPAFWHGPPRPSQPPGDRRLGNDIDAFVHARLASIDVSAGPPLCRGGDDAVACNERDWLRRVSHALTGTLPDAERIAALSKTPDRKQARRMAVDNLLASPGYGARWAKLWMRDIARVDSEAVALAGYRRWVEDAFNRDLPFPQFVAAHLGEAAPSALAPALARSFLHAAADEPGAHRDKAATRTAGFGRVFLALDLECARCHDHPVDPIRAYDHRVLANWIETGRTDALDGKHDKAQDAFRELLGEPGEKNGPRALLGERNPLLARVIVNHLFRLHVGSPLVATIDDFGARGESPSHPELLDHLAAGLLAHGGSLKWLHREILLSETYARAALPGPQASRDPDNRYLWRMNTRTLDDDTVRTEWYRLAGLIMPPPAAHPPLEVPDAVARAIWTRVTHQLRDATNGGVPSTRASLAVQELYRTLLGRAPEPHEFDVALRFLRAGRERGPALVAVLLRTREFRTLM